MKLFLLILLFIPCLCFSQSRRKANIHGTVLISAIVDDTIIVVADSRGSVSDKGKVIAYIDSIPKIFPFSNGVISISGGTMLGTTYNSQVVADFNHQLSRQGSFTAHMRAFEKYLETHYPLNRMDTANEFFMGAGYEEGHPILISFNRRSGFFASQNFLKAGLMVSDGRVLDFMHFPAAGRPSALQVAAIFEQSIQDFSKTDKKTATVGGHHFHPIPLWRQSSGMAAKRLFTE